MDSLKNILKNGSDIPWKYIELIFSIDPEKKRNQTMKFGQLIEYNMRNIFVEKSYAKCAGRTIPRPLSKKSKLSISLDL